MTFAWFLGLFGLGVLFVPIVMLISWAMYFIYGPDPLPKPVHRVLITLVSLGYIAGVLYLYIPIYPV